jgi:hypothetical protein
VNNQDFLGMFMSLKNGGVPGLGFRIIPDVGTVGENNIEIERHSSGQYLISGRAIGPKFMLTIAFSLTLNSGSWTTATPTWALVANENCSLSNQASNSTSSASKVTFSSTAVVTVGANKAGVWSLVMTGTNPITASTSPNVTCISSVQLMQHVYDAPPTLAGCPYRFLHTKYGIERAIGAWHKQDACDTETCPVCPYGRLLSGAQTIHCDEDGVGHFVQLVENPDSDDSDDEEKEVEEKKKRDRKQK